MKISQWLCVKIIIGLFSLFFISTGGAVIILDSTYDESGFDASEELANRSQFSSLMLLYNEKTQIKGSGAWIGNYEGHGYILTAAHMFLPGEVKATYYNYETVDGTDYYGEKVFINPYYSSTNKQRGYDFAIVRLTEEVTTADSQPLLFDGDMEQGMMITFMGYGRRGIGTSGQNSKFNLEENASAAEGRIELYREAVDPFPEKGNGGNYIGIWLPKEDGSIKNPFGGTNEPASRLIGLLGSGDSGGPAWIKTPDGWAIAAVCSSGTGNASYGEYSWFSVIGEVRDWIEELVPTAKFIDQE